MSWALLGPTPRRCEKSLIVGDQTCDLNCVKHARLMRGAAYHRHGHRHCVVGDGRRIVCMHLKVCVRRTLIWQGEGGGQGYIK